MSKPSCRPVTTPADVTVTTDDGVTLHAEISGDHSAAVTVVLCHGYGLGLSSWCLQRAELEKHARVVAWDHRGHGLSGYGDPGSGAIDRLGRDLHHVLSETVPAGPVVLAGHSMGGMTIMALAEQHPELFGDPITGVALLATSAGPINPSLGLPGGAAAALQLAAHWAARWIGPDLIHLLRPTRRLPGSQAIARRLVRQFAFASPVSDVVVDLVLDMIDETQPAAFTDLLQQFRPLDKRAALAALGRVSTQVMVGEQDLLTPPRDSEAIATAVPGADLVTLPGTGHGLILERGDLVNEWLLPLIQPAPLRSAS